MSTQTRLKQQMDFILEVDKLKQIQRQTYTTTKNRHENSSEHSWHIALMALILQEHSKHPTIDLFKAVKMLLIHDIVEIDAGDTFLYDKQAQKNKHKNETKAAKRIFNLLPKDQAQKLQNLWNEFEENKTPTAKYANALDRLQPIINNYHTNGKAWQQNNVKKHQIEASNTDIEKGSPTLWEYATELIKKAITEGKLAE